MSLINDGINWVKTDEEGIPVTKVLEELTWAGKPSAAAFGKGQAWFRDIGAMGYSDGTNWYPSNDTKNVSVSSDNTAAENTSAIQSALNSGGKIRVSGRGVALINDTLKLFSDTDLTIDYGLTIKQSTTVSKSMFKTSSITDEVGASVTMAWTQGLRVTVTWADHGKIVGDYIWFSGADQPQYNGIYLVSSVTDTSTFVIIVDRMPAVTATGTILAKTPNKNITLNINGTLDYDYATKSAGVPIDKLAVILSGVNIRINNATINNSSKYCLCVGAVRHMAINNIHSDTTQSDLIKVYGPAYDVAIDGVTGVSGDDFISLQGIEPPAYIGYMWSSGDVINVTAKNIMPSKTGISSTFTIYGTSSGQLVDNITVENVDIINRLTIKHNEGETACKVGNFIVKNVKAPDDSLWAQGGISVEFNGTIDSLTLQDTHGCYWPKEFITVDALATVKKITVKNCGLKSSANHIVNNAGVINSLFIYDNSLDQGTSATYLRIVKNANTINFIDFYNNRCNKITAVVEQVSGVVAGGIISVRNNYLSDIRAVFELIQDSEVRFFGNIGDVFASKHILNINASGKAVKVHTGQNVITFNSGSVFIKRTVGNELVSVFGNDLPVALDALNRAIPGQIVKASAAVGTILINETCVNDTTNTTGSWHQLSNPSLVY